MSREWKLSRRAWLAASAPLWAARQNPKRKPASERVTVGMIGMGRQAVFVNAKQFLKMDDVQIVAVCDVDSWRLENAKRQVEDGGHKGVRAFRDYRELLADKSIDAVMISTPDHWHVPMSLDALRAGKDVSCEKPLTRTIAEGRELADTAQKLGRVFRNDSEFRSMMSFHMACELVRNGRIGQLKNIVAGVPGTDIGCPPQPDMPVPPDLDYERWQGPAPRAPYTEFRVHKPRAYDRPGWMRHRFYCDGMVANWGAHLIDIAQWGNDTDRTGPVEVEATGAYPEAGSFWNVMIQFEARYRYANGVTLTYKTDQPYIRFEGTEGSVYADMDSVRGKPTSVGDVKSGPRWRHLPFLSDKRDFIDAVKSRAATLEDAEVGHRTMSICHLAQIAVRTGKRLEWDPQRERFTNDEAANRWVKEAFLT